MEKKTTAFLITSVCIFLIYIISSSKKDINKHASIDSNSFVRKQTSSTSNLDKTRTQLEKKAFSELSPKDKWLSYIEEDDYKALSKAYNKKSGLNLKEIKKNKDGTYDAVFHGSSSSTQKKLDLLTKKEFLAFRKNFIKRANKGKNVNIDDTDLKEIIKFRNQQD